MKTPEQIQDKIKLVGAKLDENISLKQREVIDAILDVLENELEYEEIEEKYFDNHETDNESSANKTKEWMEDEITDDEFDEFFNF